MAGYDRDPYAPPTEPPLTIGQHRPIRGGGPAPVTLIISIVLLAAAAGGVFMLYRGGVRGASDAPRTVGAPIGKLKIAAPPQTLAADPAAGLSIYREGPGASAAAPAFVPPPEQPGPRPVAAPVASAPIRAAPLEATPPAAPAAAAPAVVPPAAAKVKPTRPKPDIAGRAAPLPTEPVAPTPTPAKSSGPAMVQIGAFSSTALADKGWSAAAAVAPGAMAGKGKKVEPITKDGGALYRTSITGFASREEARALCDRLIAAGKSCFVK